MSHKAFLKRLRQQLPDWVEHGWVVRGSEAAILTHAAERAGGSHFLAYALSVLGVLLLGTGVISYFAANWPNMPKLVKLLLLFGSLWGAYAVAAYALGKDRYPYLGQALLLLGVILFGANIMLIAQIYHIDSHYPNGVLVWSLGGLLTAYVLRAQAAMIAAILLAMLWTGMESFGFDQPNWGFLILWAALLPRIYQCQWRPALHVAMMALLLWSLFTLVTIDWRWSDTSLLYATQLYFLIYLALFLVGMLMATTRRLADYASIVQRYSIFAVLTSFYALTFPRLQSGRRWSGDEFLRQAADSGWVALILGALVVVVALALWHRQRTMSAQRPAYLVWGQWLIAAAVVLVLSNLGFTGVHGGPLAIAFNLLFFAGIVWLIVAGRQWQERYLVNIAFAFFALTLVSRYFDTFWSLMNRSFFFMAGGLLLIVGGYFLERQRRRLTGEIGQGRGAGAGR